MLRSIAWPIRRAAGPSGVGPRLPPGHESVLPRMSLCNKYVLHVLGAGILHLPIQYPAKHGSMEPQRHSLDICM
jgi:hypothetical protein